MAKKDKIQINFVGGNSYDVTGSCIYIESEHVKILLELGLWQDCKSTLSNYKINNEKFDFKAKDIQYIFAPHATHSDHIGRIPLLYSRGGNAEIVAPRRTKQIAEVLMRDTAHIFECDAMELSEKFKRDYKPIYYDSDVDVAMKHYNEYDMDEIVQLNEYIRFRFIKSRHILNSASLELWITEGNKTKKIYYSSDLGNLSIKNHYVDNFEFCGKCDIAIVESTYAKEKRIVDQKVRNKDIEKLKSCIIQTCVDQNSTVLFPVFANQRLQSILTELYMMFKDEDFDIPVYVDTKMGVNICNIFSDILIGEDAELWKEVLAWKNIHFIKDNIESREVRDDPSAKIVLSASGMCMAGRVLSHLGKVLPCENARIVFCGYASSNSLADNIKNGLHKTISVSGKRVANKCQITDLHSFTSHIQRDSMIKVYGSIDCEKLILVHGDLEGRLGIKDEIQEEISKNNLTSKVVVANKGYSLTI